MDFWMVWDLVAVLVIAYYIYRCARRGFLRTVVGFIAYTASAVAASVLSGPLAQFVYDAVVRDALRASISRRVASAAASGEAQTMLSAIPGWMRNLIGSEGAPGLLTEIDAAGAAEALIDSALADPVVSLLRGVGFFLLFWLFSFVARRVSYLFTGVNRLPIIGLFNTFLGGALGVLQAAVTLYLIAVAVRLVIIIGGDGNALLNRSTIEAGYIFRFFWFMSG